jgi:hypothetical protein
MIVDIERLPSVYPPQRQFAYVIVREPGSFVLFKAYSDNHGTVRLAEFRTRQETDEFLNELPPGKARGPMRDAFSSRRP